LADIRNNIGTRATQRSFILPTPEMSLSYPDSVVHSEKSNIFQLGFLLFFCLFKDLPFGKVEDMQHKTLVNTANIDKYFKSHRATRGKLPLIGLELKNLLRDMLSIDANNRPNAEQLLQYKWITVE
jgi:serine/threonine protein kinase